MKKLILFAALFCATSSHAINPFSWFWTIKLTGDTATVAKWKANNDSVLNWSTRISDTVTNKIPRKTDFSDHLYTFPWMNIDTIPSADSVKTTRFYGQKARLDTVYSADTIKTTSLYSRRSKLDTIKSCDTAFIAGAKISRIDSVYSVKGIKGTSGTYSSSVSALNFSGGKVTTDTILYKTRGDATVWLPYASGITAGFTTFIGNGLFNYAQNDSVLANKVRVVDSVICQKFKVPSDTVPNRTTGWVQRVPVQGVAACTLFDNSAVLGTVDSAKYTIIGNIALVTLPKKTGTLAANTGTSFHLPKFLQGVSAETGPIILLENSIYINGQYTVNTVNPWVGIGKTANPNRGLLAAGTGGLDDPVTIMYRIK